MKPSVAKVMFCQWQLSEIMCGGIGGMVLTGEDRRTWGGGGGVPVSVPLLPPQTPYTTACDGTRTSE
jgi:hypothetical protein